MNYKVFYLFFIKDKITQDEYKCDRSQLLSFPLYPISDWKSILLGKKHIYSKISECIFFYTLSHTIFSKKNRCKMKGFLTIKAIKPKQRCWAICIFQCSRFKIFIRFSQSLWTKKIFTVVRTWEFRDVKTPSKFRSASYHSCELSSIINYSFWDSLLFFISEIEYQPCKIVVKVEKPSRKCLAQFLDL